MENFTIYNPSKVIFGENSLAQISNEAKKLGKKILLVYGQSSIKKTGLYDRIIHSLEDFDIVEYSGIKPNPVIDDVNKAADIARQNQVEMIIAVGGGSVIDSAKLISVAQHFEGDAWAIMKHEFQPTIATPIIAVLTLAATGTEMNPFAVVQNPQTQEKIGWGSPLTYPKVSILDPNLTTTVPVDYTAFGLADMVAHVLEAYFGDGDSPLSDSFAFSIIKEIIQIGDELLENPEDYQLRARAMYAGTMALNGLLTQGKKGGDWGVHAIGHTLSMLYDTPHGATLTIAYPAWMKFHSEKLEHRIEKLGKGVFGVEDKQTTIHLFEEFFTQIGCPINLEEIGLNQENKSEIVELLNKNHASGVFHSLDENAREYIVNLMFLKA